MENTNIQPTDILAKAEALRNNLSTGFRDEIVKSLYAEEEYIAQRAVKSALNQKYDFDLKVDRLVTSPIVGLPIMVILLGIIIWLAVSGATVLSEAIASLLFGFGDIGRNFFNQIGMPWWVTGFIWEGVYLALAWVGRVMLPPMAIFFPAGRVRDLPDGGSGRRRGWSGRVTLLRQPLRPQRRDDEQRSDADGRGLREDEPEAAQHGGR